MAPCGVGIAQGNPESYRENPGLGTSWEEGRSRGAGAPVFELHHLLLPRVQAPSLGVDGEEAVVLCTHLVELSAAEVSLLCPQIQVQLLVTWKEERPGEGKQEE